MFIAQDSLQCQENAPEIEGVIDISSYGDHKGVIEESSHNTFNKNFLSTNMEQNHESDKSSSTYIKLKASTKRYVLNFMQYAWFISLRFLKMNSSIEHFLIIGEGLKTIKTTSARIYFTKRFLETSEDS